LFIAEVTSASTRRRDLTEKRELYREWKVPYLIIDRSTDPFTMRTEGNLPAYAQLLADLGQPD